MCGSWLLIVWAGSLFKFMVMDNFNFYDSSSDSQLPGSSESFEAKNRKILMEEASEAKRRNDCSTKIS
nr:MAG TPA: hypothetical protein [Caudoviricetes sp.]